MTDLELQDVLIQEIKELAESQSLRKLDGEVWKDYNIYRQEKPYKDDEEDADQEDYIIVIIGDEDADSEGRWVVTMHIVISIMLLEKEHQGNIILANWMNQLDLHLCKKGVIGGRYEMEKERYKRFNRTYHPNYYECEYITRWTLPEMNREGIVDLV